MKFKAISTITPPPSNILTKSKAFLLSIFLILFAFAMITCDENVEDVELDGTTWRYTDEGGIIVLTFSGTNFIWSQTATEGQTSMGTYSKTGTYSVSGNNVTLTPSDDSATLTLTSSGNTLTLNGYIFTKQ